MNANDVPRIAAPLLLAAAILVSFRLEKPAGPVELPGGDLPMPSAVEIRASWEQAIAPSGPGFDRGATRARVTVLEFADYGCPYCALFASAVYPTIAAEYVTTGRVRWKNVPFALGMFTNGSDAARAGLCAGRQGPAAFGRMHDRLFATQDAWQRARDPEGAFRSLAVAAGLDGARFAACYGSTATDTVLRAANDLADRMAVRATPTFFVNGRRVQGALPVEEFRDVLDDALRRSRSF